MNLNLKLITAAAAVMMAAAPAMADLTFTALSYRTGPYASGGVPFADGYQDYFTLMNERDGGIGGEKVTLVECETGYNTEKGVECYEATKGSGALLYQPLSTGISYQLIPKVTADNISMHTLGYGRTSVKNGEVFRWVFNYPTNYWDGASVAIKHILDLNGGDISGKKITLVYHNSAYGKEPIRTLEELARKHGYDLTLLAVDHPGQEQKSQWLQIRRERPDYVIMWGWGVMNQIAIQEAINIRFPMDRFIGSWWSSSETDLLPSGEAADGYKVVTFHNFGSDYPIYADLKKYVVDTGKAAGAGDMLGTALYNRGLYAAMLAVEATKTAQEIHKTKAITTAMLRDGMEHLEMTEERMTALGMPKFGPEFKVTCQNHGGNGRAAVAQWDAKARTFGLITDYMESDQDVIAPLIAEDSAAYAKEAGITPGCN